MEKSNSGKDWKVELERSLRETVLHIGVMSWRKVKETVRL